MPTQKRFIWLATVLLLSACAVQDNQAPQAQDPVAAVLSFCQEIARRGDRNVNLKECAQTGVLTEQPKEPNAFRAPSSVVPAYTFRGKMTHVGRPVVCTADRTDYTEWKIKHCQNE